MFCSVCLRDDNRTENLDDLPEIVSLLQKYVDIKIQHMPERNICGACHESVSNFSKFLEQIVEAHGNAKHQLDTIGATSKATDDDPKPEMVFVKSEPQDLGIYYAQAGRKMSNLQDEDDDEDDDEVCDEKDDGTPEDTQEDRLDGKAESSTTAQDEEANETIYQGFIKKYCEVSCGTCKLQVSTFAELQRHCWKEHKSKGYIRCCERKFYHKKRLNEHIRLHLNPEKFKCDICNRLCASSGSLRNHKLSKHPPTAAKRFECDVCRKTFISLTRLKSHKQIHVAVTERGFKCEFCDRSFGTAYTLRYHIGEKHKEERRFVCEACGKGFYRKYAFELHVSKHCKTKAAPGEQVDPERERCELCDKWMTKESLRKHKAAHMDPNAPYFCDTCGKESPSKRAHIAHVRSVHMMTKSIKCNICDKMFKKPISLKEHMAVHTGNSLYSCPFCNKTFNANGNLYMHKKREHYEQWKEERANSVHTKGGQ